jgi:hypothetical protein
MPRSKLAAGGFKAGFVQGFYKGSLAINSLHERYSFGITMKIDSTNFPPSDSSDTTKGSGRHT